MSFEEWADLCFSDDWETRMQPDVLNSLRGCWKAAQDEMSDEFKHLRFQIKESRGAHEAALAACRNAYKRYMNLKAALEVCEAVINEEAKQGIERNTQHSKGRDCSRTEEVLESYRKRAVKAEGEIVRLRELLGITDHTLQVIEQVREKIAKEKLSFENTGPNDDPDGPDLMEEGDR